MAGVAFIVAIAIAVGLDAYFRLYRKPQNGWLHEFDLFCHEEPASQMIHPIQLRQPQRQLRPSGETHE